MLKLLGDEMMRMQVWMVCFLQAFKTSPPSSKFSASKPCSNGTNGTTSKVNGGSTTMADGDRVRSNGNGSLRKRKERGCTPLPIGQDPTLSISDVPSILDIRKAVPSECFKSDLVKSMSYVLKDVFYMVVLYGVLLVLERQPYTSLYYTYLPIYWSLQGTMFWAVFVLGHDCGHNSFSGHQLVNDYLGLVLHSFILVPFYPWKLSHKHHHSNTGNIDKDEIFYPIREKDIADDFTRMLPYFGLGTSWFMYLFAGYMPRVQSHFNIYESIYKNHALDCFISIVGWVISLACWVYYGYCYGVWAVMSHYVIPLNVFAAWIVMVTFLHHSDTEVPWFSDKTWNFVRGQLSSVDRHYGWAHSLTHNIGTHQVHHLFCKIPHYKLEEATTAFRSKFPSLVRKSDKPAIPDFLRIFRVFARQRCIGDDVDIHVYRD